MTQMDAKLFYQLEQQKSAAALTPIQLAEGSPVTSPAEFGFGELPGAALNWPDQEESAFKSTSTGVQTEDDTRLSGIAALDGVPLTPGSSPLGLSGSHVFGGSRNTDND